MWRPLLIKMSSISIRWAHGPNNIWEGQRSLIPMRQINKLMERWVHAFANNVWENNRKQTVNKIYPYCVRGFAFCVTWLGAVATRRWRIHKEISQLSIFQLIVDNWTTLWHTSSIVCVICCSVAWLPLVRDEYRRNSCDIFRARCRRTKDNRMWIFGGCECVFLKRVATVEPRPLTSTEIYK